MLLIMDLFALSCILLAVLFVVPVTLVFFCPFWGPNRQYPITKEKKVVKKSGTKKRGSK